VIQHVSEKLWNLLPVQQAEIVVHAVIWRMVLHCASNYSLLTFFILCYHDIPIMVIQLEFVLL
jgi:hypothetical protein